MEDPVLGLEVLDIVTGAVEGTLKDIGLKAERPYRPCEEQYQVAVPDEPGDQMG
jgi:hypothetical protein